MKVAQSVLGGPRASRRGILVVVIAMAVSLSAPAQAHAITRTKILKRANSLGQASASPTAKAATTEGTAATAPASSRWRGRSASPTRRARSPSVPSAIKISSLKPGDAVLRPGHVSDLRRLEEQEEAHLLRARSRPPGAAIAKKRVRKIPRGAKALRRKGLTRPKRRPASRCRPRPALPLGPTGFAIVRDVTCTGEPDLPVRQHDCGRRFVV